MQYLNYLYFIILTYIEVKYLFSSGHKFAGPFDKKQLYWFNGDETFWVLLFSTGLFAFSVAGAIDLMAIRLLALEILCVVALFNAKQKQVWTPTFTIYTIFLTWILIGCFYSPSFGYGFRVVLKYLYPILIAMTASAIVDNQVVFIKSSLWARKIGIICLIISLIPFLEWFVFPGVFWYGTASAIHFISLMILSVGLFFVSSTFKEKRTNFILAIIFLMPCFIWVYRTSIMGSGIALMVFSFFRYKLKSLPIIIGLILAGIIAVFTIPSLREKMFYSDDVSLEMLQQGKISQDDINSNARYAMWEHLENNFYKEHELIGSGTGSVQNYMYTNHVFGGLKVAHSDYVQMRCDNGEIGFWLYIVMMLSLVVHCFNTYWSYNNNAIKLAAIIAGSSAAGVMACMYSDNVVNYSIATLSMPFGFYGMMLGMLRNYKNTGSV